MRSAGGAMQESLRAPHTSKYRPTLDRGDLKILPYVDRRKRTITFLSIKYCNGVVDGESTLIEFQRTSGGPSLAHDDSRDVSDVASDLI
nr:hypothetical protein CFP56_57562 [Quercus suber]